MLELRPNCEQRDRDLPPDSSDAYICTFECTFCRDCTETVFAHRCPNYGRNLVQRPIRTPEALQRHPASTARVLSRRASQA